MVKINGENSNSAGKILSEYLAENNYDTKRIVVEINENIVPKDQYDKTVFKDGDTVEVVSFVGGG